MLYGASEYGKLAYGGAGDADTLLISSINDQLTLVDTVAPENDIPYDIITIIENMLRELECNVSPGGNKGIQVVTP